MAKCEHKAIEVVICRGRLDFYRCTGCGATFNDVCSHGADV